MTAIKTSALRGAENDIDNAVALIKAVYNVIYTVDREDGPALLATLKAGTRLLRLVHFRLCDAIGEGGEGLMYTKAEVNGVPSRRGAIFEQLDIAAVTVLAAAKSPFLLAADDVRQEAAVEQMRSAAIILKNVIEHVENPSI